MEIKLAKSCIYENIGCCCKRPVSTAYLHCFAVDCSIMLNAVDSDSSPFLCHCIVFLFVIRCFQNVCLNEHINFAAYCPHLDATALAVPSHTTHGFMQRGVWARDDANKIKTTCHRCHHRTQSPRNNVFLWAHLVRSPYSLALCCSASLRLFLVFAVFVLVVLFSVENKFLRIQPLLRTHRTWKWNECNAKRNKLCHHSVYRQMIRNCSSNIHFYEMQLARKQLCTQCVFACTCPHIHKRSGKPNDRRKNNNRFTSLDLKRCVYVSRIPYAHTHTLNQRRMTKHADIVPLCIYFCTFCGYNTSQRSSTCHSFFTHETYIYAPFFRSFRGSQSFGRNFASVVSCALQCPTFCRSWRCAMESRCVFMLI